MCRICVFTHIYHQLSVYAVPVVLGFEQSSYTVREMDGSVILCVNVTEPAVLRREVTLTVVSIPGTASELT